jgi:hypothetical protein
MNDEKYFGDSSRSGEKKEGVNDENKGTYDEHLGANVSGKGGKGGKDKGGRGEGSSWTGGGDGGFSIGARASNTISTSESSGASVTTHTSENLLYRKLDNIVRGVEGYIGNKDLSEVEDQIRTGVIGVRQSLNKEIDKAKAVVDSVDQKTILEEGLEVGDKALKKAEELASKGLANKENDLLESDQD